MPSIISCSLGNLLEWYDFGLFVVFSSLFNRLFFPTSAPQTAYLATLSVFAIGFFCRPIGAIIFGYLGDKYGRAITLRLSILMILLPTLFIGLIPTWEQAGVAAPIMLIIIRMLQGISIGGEYSGNLLYLVETSPSRYRATFTALAATSANTGILLATLVGMLTSSLMSEATLQSWGWRVPYLLSGILCLVIYRFRLRIHETPAFHYLQKHHLLTSNPLKTLLTTYKADLFRTMGLMCMGSTFYYFCFIYVPFYLTNQLKYSIETISLMISLILGMMIVLVPVAGWICDKMGRRKMFLMNATLIMLVTIPGFYLLHANHFWLVIAVLIIFMIASSLEQGATSITAIEHISLPVRYSGISLGYNLVNGILGGTVPMICGWLQLRFVWTVAPPLYIVFCAGITWLVVYALREQPLARDVCYQRNADFR